MAHNIRSQDRIRRGGMILVWIVVLSLLLAACGSDQKTYTIGVVNPVHDLYNTVEGFKQGMTELGYVEGENITYIDQGPVGMQELDAVAQGLVAADVDLILSLTTPATQAAQRATAGTDIPVVFMPVTDPVGAGIVDSLTSPGGNATGITYSAQEGRRLEWLMQVVPTIERIYIVYNPEDQSPVLALEAVSEAATILGVELITREACTPEEATVALENTPKEADAIFILPEAVIAETDWYDIAIELELPTSGPNANLVEDGALTAYGVDLPGSARQDAARLADQILRGTKPADLPVEMADFHSAINLKTAEAIGLDVPDEVLLQADIIVR